MARTSGGLIVVVGSNRVSGVEAAAAEGADVAILDDGFQHRRLARDLDLLLLDSSDPFGGARLLPVGRLREPLSAMARADLVLLTRSRSRNDLEAIERAVRRYRPGVPILTADHESVGFVDADGRATAPGPRIVAFCGIGNPAGFERDLRASGLELVELRVFRDHHTYSTGELAALERRARSAGAVLVTTEKDLARLSGDGSHSPRPIAALRIRAVVDQPGPLLERLGELR